MKTILAQLIQLPPTASTVYGLAVLGGLACYWITGSMEGAVFVAGVFKVLCPQDAAAIDAGLAADRGIATAPRPMAAIGAIVAIGLLAAVTACNPATPAAITSPAAAASAATPKPTPASVCGDIAAAKAAPDVATQLNGVDPHSALGVLWADVQSGCNGAAPIAGVNASWTTEVLGMLQAALPTVLPLLVGLI